MPTVIRCSLHSYISGIGAAAYFRICSILVGHCSTTDNKWLGPSCVPGINFANLGIFAFLITEYVALVHSVACFGARMGFNL